MEINVTTATKNVGKKTIHILKLKGDKVSVSVTVEKSVLQSHAHIIHYLFHDANGMVYGAISRVADEKGTITIDNTSHPYIEWMHLT